jgi:ATP-dependent DNA ligase
VKMLLLGVRPRGFVALSCSNCLASRRKPRTRCKLGLEGIVSKKLNAPYKSGPSNAWLKIKNPKAPAATRATDGTF